ncbi:hypothetical protein [Helicobacter sp. MIT 05-5294]|uniref:hypothetical protein n=1 Tax=Helicobacter sp. MIT 05-5294 TaxID=1548150 RepID=UPI000B02B6B3|nr:hypothetical protein [Helicobacter sp. MIT 05-5294]
MAIYNLKSRLKDSIVIPFDVRYCGFASMGEICSTNCTPRDSSESLAMTKN